MSATHATYDQQTYHPVNTIADARKTELEQAVCVH